MKLKLYNSLTRTTEVFHPTNASHGVGMYVCGPTVYDRAHIGNARPAIIFDVLYRLLMSVYGYSNVTYVRNFTDVDDKINAKAERVQHNDETLVETVHRITSETIDWYHQDMDALGVLRPTREPRATEYIIQMIEMIEKLINLEHAYVSNNHVFFSVSSDPDHGVLSNRLKSAKSQQESRRYSRMNDDENQDFKREPEDFVLWKPSSASEPGWESPWGYGRPGWHIECSAMASDLLGEHFDIHGGGIDLQFPHHENELAQSRCVGHKSANIWMHNGHLMVEGEKMSKSLGNFITVNDLLEKNIPGEVIRLAMLMTHYQAPINWNNSTVELAKKTLINWYNLVDAQGSFEFEIEDDSDHDQPSEVIDALYDNLNTPLAIAHLHKYANSNDVKKLVLGAKMLGLLTPELIEWKTESQLSDESIMILKDIMKVRQVARFEKDWQKSDEIRDNLKLIGIEILDSNDTSSYKLEKSDIQYQLLQNILEQFNE